MKNLLQWLNKFVTNTTVLFSVVVISFLFRAAQPWIDPVWHEKRFLPWYHWLWAVVMVTYGYVIYAWIMLLRQRRKDH